MRMSASVTTKVINRLPGSLRQLTVDNIPIPGLPDYPNRYSALAAECAPHKVFFAYNVFEYQFSLNT